MPKLRFGPGVCGGAGCGALGRELVGRCSVPGACERYGENIWRLKLIIIKMNVLWLIQILSTSFLSYFRCKLQHR